MLNVAKTGIESGLEDYHSRLGDFGWYPELREFCSASILCRFKPDWLELLTEILDHYLVEYLMIRIVYSTVFY